MSQPILNTKSSPLKGGKALNIAADNSNLKDLTFSPKLIAKGDSNFAKWGLEDPEDEMP